jgi:hypothetical protein
MKLFVVAVGMSKMGVGQTITTMWVHWRKCETEDEARGSAVSAAMIGKPDFCVSHVLATEIMPDTMRAVLGITEEVIPVAETEIAPDVRKVAHRISLLCGYTVTCVDRWESTGASRRGHINGFVKEIEDLALSIIKTAPDENQS